MQVYSFVTAGFEGHLISVKAYIRRGIPTMDIIGLPDGAVREARERIRVAILQSGFEFPGGSILIDMAPADIRKEGALFDLSLAAAVLIASGQINNGSSEHWLILGELELSGRLRPVKGTISAVSSALKGGIRKIMVPSDNFDEAVSAGAAEVVSLNHLKEIKEILSEKRQFPAPSVSAVLKNKSITDNYPDIRDLKGQAHLKRALMVAAAGGHHMLLFGPPGSGKTLGATMLEGLLPDLTPSVSHEVSRIWSQAGKLGRGNGMVSRPPFRMPHHSASMEGLIGGGMQITPGEISLAHGGVLFLDETPEFQGRILQSLREPLENGRVTIVRGGQSYWYPSRFQLLMAANPCPCGNLGKRQAVCVCSSSEINRYWKKVGGALIDRIDIRIPVEPVSPDLLLTDAEESSADLRERIESAVQRQADRYEKLVFSKNRDIPTGLLQEYCSLNRDLKDYFARISRQLGLSSRACHSILKVSRTIADLRDSEIIRQEDIEEAGQYRRYGDSDFFWNQK